MPNPGGTAPTRRRLPLTARFFTGVEPRPGGNLLRERSILHPFFRTSLSLSIVLPHLSRPPVHSMLSLLIYTVYIARPAPPLCPVHPPSSDAIHFLFNKLPPKYFFLADADDHVRFRSLMSSPVTSFVCVCNDHLQEQTLTTRVALHG